MDVIVDYMSQVLVHEECPLHCVSFEFIYAAFHEDPSSGSFPCKISVHLV